MKTFFIVLFYIVIACNTSHAQIVSKEGIYKGCYPLSLTLYSQTPKTSYNWDLGNGSSSTSDTVNVTYSTSEIYVVKLDSDSVLIEVIDKPSVNIDSLSPRFGCLPFTFSVKDKTVYPAGVTGVHFKWIFGNGDTASGNPLTHTIQNYEPKVDVTIQITTSISSCNTSLTFKDYLSPLSVPNTTISYSPKTSCYLPLKVNFSNATTHSAYDIPKYEWTWSNPTPNISTNKDISPQTYNQTGTFKVYLKATNKYGCSRTDTAIITIDTPKIPFISDDSICIGNLMNKIKISNYNTSNFTYYFDVTNFIFNPIDTAFYVNPSINNQGLYNYSLKAISKTDPRCTTIFSKNIFVVSPKPILFHKPPLYCNLPIIDTIHARNTDKLTDSIIYNILFIDKYRDSIFLIKKTLIGKDTIYPYIIPYYKDFDSFYRKEACGYKVSLRYYNVKTDCYGDIAKTYLLRNFFDGYLTSNKTKGCKNLNVRFEVNTNSDTAIATTKWYFGDGNSTTSSGDSVKFHTYTNSGKYKAYCILYSASGCIDTTNPIWITVGDSIPPTFTLNKTTFCVSDTLVLTNTSSTSYQNTYALVDYYESGACPNVNPVNFYGFRHTGKIPVILVGSKDGCIAKTVDTVSVNGAFARLEYDFKCSRRDSILFIAKGKSEVNSFEWDFGDGTGMTTTADSVWHKFGLTNNYNVKLKAINNATNCIYIDSTLIHIRHVKAKMKVDSILCKIINESEIYNGLPYKLDPLLSTEADYLCNYNYTWFFEGPGVSQRPVTFGDIVELDYFHNKFTLGLIARDVNGCTDTVRQSMWVDTTVIDFKIDKIRYCMNQDVIQITNLSSSPFGIKQDSWDIKRLRGITVATSTQKNPTFTLNSNKNQVDTFIITLILKDSGTCANKIMSKYIIFYRDTSKFINYTDTVCLGNKCNILYNDSLSNTSYKWYINNILQPQSTHRFNIQMNTIGIQNIKLVKTNLDYGCKDSFFTKVNVKPRPRLRFQNTADTSKTLCFPSKTDCTISDTNNNVFWVNYYHNNKTPTQLNPSTFYLDGGINKMMVIVTTASGCIDTLYDQDTVLKPSGIIEYSKNKICKGEDITFMLKNKSDVDSFVWNYGTGIINSSKKDTVTYNYNQTVLNRDSTTMSVVLYGVNGICPQALNKIIYIYEAIPDFKRNHGTDTAYCFGPISLLNTSKKGDYFKWNMDNGVFQNSKDIANYQYQYPGTYNIKLYAYRDSLGCVDSISKKIILFPIPKISASLDTICEGALAYLKYKDTLSPTSQNLFIENIKIKSNTTSPIELSLNDDKELKLVSTSLDGCKDSTTIKPIIIRKFNLPMLDTIVVMGNKVIFPLIYNPKYTYTWTPKDDSFSCQNCSNPIYQVLGKKEFLLTVSNERNCFSMNTKYILDIYPDIKVVVPTAFTPNGDGSNDIIYARGYGIKKLNYFKIFNRYGQLLFTSYHENDGWDGYYKNVLQNSEPYFYYYEATSFIPGKIISGEGNFMLLK